MVKQAPFLNDALREGVIFRGVVFSRKGDRAEVFILHVRNGDEKKNKKGKCQEDVRDKTIVETLRNLCGKRYLFCQKKTFFASGNKLQTDGQFPRYES